MVEGLWRTALVAVVALIGGVVWRFENLLRENRRLRDSEARHRAITDCAVDSIVTCDEDGRILAANPATEKLFGYKPDELAGQNVGILAPDGLAEAHDKFMNAYRRTGIAKILGSGREVGARARDGTPLDIELSVSEWRDAEGRRFFTGVMRDIGPRKAAEDALRKFRRVVEQTAAAVVITDSDGIIEYVNPRFSEVSGYGAREAIGRKPSLMKSGLTPLATYRELWSTIAAGDVWRGDLRNRRKDGSLYWEHATISPVRDASGEITHFAAVQEEITARKDMEDQLASAQRMEGIGRLAGSVAHDFNNLLAVIAGNLELIMQAEPAPAIAALARPALDAAEAGAAYTRRLLSLSAQRPASPSLFAPNERIAGIRSLLERIAGGGVEWTYRLAADLWPVLADPGEVDSALLNLTTNSRDAMPEGGRVVLETRNATLDVAEAAALSSEARPGDYVCIAMTDSGHGMRKEVLSRAFEPFFTTKSEGKGAGLGLSGVRNFVTRAGGFVTLVSHEGDGATVSLYLPRSLAARVDEEGVPPLGDGQVVLIVDDDERVREVTARRVEALGYVVETARSGAEAVAILQSGLRVDALLSDVVMPGGMNGFELVRWVRAHAPQVKSTLVTGFNGGFAAGEPALDAPLLQKPFTRDALARTLASALAHSGAASPAKT